MNTSLSAAGRRGARSRRRRSAAVLVLSAGMQGALVASLAAQPPAQPPPAAPAAAVPAAARVLTLDDALGLAGAGNEQVDVARAGVARAAGNALRVRSERLPQLSGSAAYDRALQSEFSGLFESSGPTCTPLQVDATAPLEDRVTEIERALVECPPTSNPFASSDDDNQLPFGRKNTFRIGVVFSQLVYTGGRIRAQERQAQLARANADATLTSTEAQLALDVSQAFYDAALADRAVAITEESYAQADRAYAQTRAQREAGRTSEFELLRAQVSRDTLQPEVVRQRALRDVAYLRLKQLLNVPLTESVQLAANLDDDVLPPPQRFATALAEAESAGVPSATRTAVGQAVNDVQSQEQAVTIARSQRKPTVSVNSVFGLVAYPPVLPTFVDWRRNWTIGASVSLPIMTGGRIAAEEAIARAGVEEQKARLSLIRELADLDAASVRAELDASLAAWRASAGTVQQANRAYEIADLRYREGLSTQLELSDSRLLLAQAQVNRATAARALQVARVRLALLPRLPLSSAGAGTGSALTAAGGLQAGAQQQTQTQTARQATVQGVRGTTGTSGVQ